MTCVVLEVQFLYLLQRLCGLQVRERRFAPFVRLEVEADMPAELIAFLVHELSLSREQDVYRVPQVLELEQLAKTTRCACL